MPWRGRSFELPMTAIANLLELAELGPNDEFTDLGSGTGSVVIEAVKQTSVKKAIGVEIERLSHEKARLKTIETLTRRQLERVDLWYGDIYSDDFDYGKSTAVFNSFEEDEEEIGFYRTRFARRHLRVLKKDLPFVGYAPSRAIRVGRAWIFRMDFPLSRIRRKSDWAGMVLNRPGVSLQDVFDHYRNALVVRGISTRDVRLALNHLELLAIKRF